MAYLRTIFFSSLLSFFFAINFVFLRYGFEVYYWSELVQVTGFSLLLLNCPFLVRFGLQRYFSDFRPLWYLNIGLWQIIVLTSTVICGFLIGNNPYVSLGLVVVGIIAFLTTACIYAKSSLEPKELLLFAIFILIAMNLVGRVWGIGFLSPLYVEKLIAGINVADDPLFHISVASMIKTYLVSSTGLQGTPYLSYHHGSHFIFAQLSGLFNLKPVHFYQMGVPIVFVSWFFSMIFMFAQDINSLLRKKCVEDNEVFNPANMLIVALLLSGLVFPFPNFRMAPGLSSESYFVSITVFLALSGVLLNFFGAYRKSKTIKKIDYVFLIFLLPLWIGGIGLLKVSTMVLAASAMVYLFFRLKFYKSMWAWLSCCLSLLIFYSVYLLGIGLQSLEIGFFPYLQIQKAAYRPYFIVVNYIWTLMLCVYFIYSAKIVDWADLQARFRRGSCVGIEVILCIAVVGTLPALLMANARGLNSFFFIDLQRWLSVCALMAMLSHSEKWNSLSWIRSKLLNVRTIIFSVAYLIPFSFILVFFLVAPYGRLVVNNYYFKRNYLEDVNAPAKTLVVGRVENWLIQASKYWHFKMDKEFSVKKPLRKIHFYAFAQNLLEISRLPEKVKRESLIYVPRSNRLYWDHLGCYQVPFVVPVLTGIAHINGLPEPACFSETDYYRKPTTYGYGSYIDMDNDKAYRPEFKTKDPCTIFGQGAYRYLIVVHESSYEVIETNDECVETMKVIDDVR